VPARVRLVASAGPRIGRGHLARALSLGEADWGDDVELELALIEGEPTPSDRDRATEAGIRVVDDGAAGPGTIVVLDVPHPAEASVGGHDPGRLVVFDDSQRFDGRAALVVQPSMPWWLGRADAGRVVAGYAWVPIGASWRAVDQGRRPGRDGRRPVVLVCFGGSDPDAVTGRLSAVVAGDATWDTRVVVGHDYAGPPPDGDVVRDPDDLPSLVADADVVLLGAGTMKFEVAALGRPAILVAVADDQRRVGPAFARTGAARWLGDGRTVDPAVVHRAVANLVADPTARETMSAAARRTIDGRGADRLANEILSLA
jgi:hypothetical protein